jgi:hypothetical protein
MNDQVTGQVECHSGYTYAEKPLAFQWEGQRLEVASIEAEWRTPTGRSFRVRTPSGQQFELCYAEREDTWQIVLI